MSLPVLEKSIISVSPTSVAIARDRDFSDSLNHFVSYSGFTALHYAVVTDDETLIQYLLKHGADPTVENYRGLTPSMYCNNERVKALLEEYTVKVCVTEVTTVKHFCAVILNVWKGRVWPSSTGYNKHACKTEGGGKEIVCFIHLNMYQTLKVLL